MYLQWNVFPYSRSHAADAVQVIVSLLKLSLKEADIEISEKIPVSKDPKIWKSTIVYELNPSNVPSKSVWHCFGRATVLRKEHK